MISRMPMKDKIIKWLRHQDIPVIKLKSGMPPRLRLVRTDAPVFDGSKIKVYVDFGHGRLTRRIK